MLVGSFLFTFCVLSLAWMTLIGGGQQRFSADPSFDPAPSLTVAPSASHDGASPRTEPTDKPAKPTTSPQTTATPASSASTRPTTGPTTTQTYVLVGGAYTSTEIPDGGSVSPSGDGVALTTDTDSTDPLRVTYSLDTSELPSGTTVASVAVRVCGEATDTSYEIDGPLGLSQSIRIGTPPESDGCWHLDAQAPTTLDVTVTVSSGTHLILRSVEYEVALAR
jgi:hypothetical protein